MRYNDMSEEERRALDHWVGSNYCIASILAGGILLMALAGAGVSASPQEANAAGRELTRSQTVAPKAGLSVIELMSIASDQLPAQPADEQAF